MTMETLAGNIAAVLEKHGPMENRDQLCRDLVSVMAIFAHVCPGAKRECGTVPEAWCATCPKC